MRRTSHTIILCFSAAVGLVAPVLAPSSAHAFEVATHAEITRSALRRLPARSIARVVAANGEQDNLGNKYDERHFNDCAFSASSTFIRNEYTAMFIQLAKAYADPNERKCEYKSCPHLEQAEAHFGALLHTIQDFYAHSNWVLLIDSNPVDAGQGLAFHGFGQFPKLPVGALAVNKADATAAATIARFAGELPEPGSNDDSLLVSGTVGDYLDGPDRSVCPAGHEWGHWDRPHLHNDDESRPNYGRAKTLAFLQTVHELQRLEAMLASNPLLLGYVRDEWAFGEHLFDEEDLRAHAGPLLPQPRGSLFSNTAWFGVQTGAGYFQGASSKASFEALADLRLRHIGLLVGVRRGWAEWLHAGLAVRPSGSFSSAVITAHVNTDRELTKLQTVGLGIGYELVPAGAIGKVGIWTINLQTGIDVGVDDRKVEGSFEARLGSLFFGL